MFSYTTINDFALFEFYPLLKVVAQYCAIITVFVLLKSSNTCILVIHVYIPWSQKDDKSPDCYGLENFKIPFNVS